MPIIGPWGLRPLHRKEYAELDYRVMRVAFECQNALGRLGEEAIYQHDVAARFRQTGLAAATEVRV